MRNDDKVDDACLMYLVMADPTTSNARNQSLERSLPAACEFEPFPQQ